MVYLIVKDRANLTPYIVFILSLLVLSLWGFSGCNCSTQTEYVIYGRGCYQCFVDYVSEIDDILIDESSSLRVEYLESNYLAQTEVNTIFEEWRVPSEYQGAVLVSVDNSVLFVNYVPVEAMYQFITRDLTGINKYLVYWDELDRVYTILDEEGKVYMCLSEDFSQCTEDPNTQLNSMLYLVLISGLLDGINPCAFSVLVFMISLLFTVQSIEEDTGLLVRVGLVYIASVFLGYLLIGVSLFQAVTFIGVHGYFAVASAVLMFLLGVINIIDCFREEKPVLSMPNWAWDLVKSHIRKTSISGAFVAGFLVSIVEFPCTGGVYLSILGLLASTEKIVQGLFYLVFYNIAFILPLVAVFIIMYFLKTDSFSFVRWRENERKLRFFSGLVFISLSLYMIFIVL